MEQGALVDAARIIARSEKLQFSVPLVRYLLRDKLVPMATFYHLQRAGNLLDSRLVNPSVRQARNSKEERLFYFAAPLLSAKLAVDLEEECSKAIISYLENTPVGVVLPVVGCFSRPTAANLAEKMKGFLSQVRTQVIVNGDSNAPQRIAEYLAGLEVKIQREPENYHDANAIKVMVREPDIFGANLVRPRYEQLGYLKRQIAEYLAPAMDSGFELKGKIARIYGDRVDVKISV